MPNVFCILCNGYPLVINGCLTQRCFTATVDIEKVLLTCEIELVGTDIEILITGVNGKYRPENIEKACRMVNNIKPHISANFRTLIEAGHLDYFKFN